MTVKDNIEGSQKETIPLIKAQDKTLLNYVKMNDTELYQVFLTMCETMLRAGECVAITKSDMDFDDRTVTIDKPLVHFKAEGEESGRLHITVTKGKI